MVAQICNHCSSKNEAGRLLHANMAAYQLEGKTKQNKKTDYQRKYIVKSQYYMKQNELSPSK